MRGVDVRGDIDAPWLFDGESFLRINGVDVIPLVEAEFNRRFPGLAHRRAGNPDDLRAAGAMLEEEWEHPAMPYATSTRSRRSPPHEPATKVKGVVRSRGGPPPRPAR
jgi:hypothetical protein